MSVQVLVDAVQLAPEGSQKPLDALFGPRLTRVMGPVLFGHDHLHDLASPGDQKQQGLGCVVAQGPELGLGSNHKARDHLGIDRIGLGPLSQGVGIGADLRRIDHQNRQSRRGEPGRRQLLVPTSRLQRHRVRNNGSETVDKCAHTAIVIGDPQDLCIGQDVNVQPILADIDPDNLFHSDPSLPKRLLVRPRRLFGFNG